MKNTIDIKKLTAPCGLACFACPVLLFVLLISLLVFSGCAATTCVRNVGVTHYRLSGKSAGTLEDGSIVVEANLFVSQITWIGIKSLPQKEKPVRRFIIATPEVVRNSIWEAQQVSMRGYTRHWICSRVCPQPEMGWQLLPYSTVYSNATVECLPEKLRAVDSLQYELSSDFPYQLNDVSIMINLAKFNMPKELEKKVSSWNAPLQILCIPAFLFDFITFPIQAFMLMNEIDRQTK